MCRWEIIAAPSMQFFESCTCRAPAEPIGTGRERDPLPIGAQETLMRCNGCWSWESHGVGSHHATCLKHE
jgi:hypothetical protein